ncbi:ferrous iron transport protein A [Capnocytophaga sp. ARDL2]|uniref:FeoA family protein n=1 Tax=Capnocytophaga sp. ARDL2 TaxID=3238809 RepID=UPI0035583994
MTLDQLSIGQSAEIIEVDIQQVPLKLIDIGCIAGNTVQLLQIAPLRDPLYLKINDSFFSIRKDLAKLIQVKIC